MATALGFVLVVLVVWSLGTARQLVETWGELYDDFGVIRYGVQTELRRTMLLLGVKVVTVAIVLYVGAVLLL